MDLQIDSNEDMVFVNGDIAFVKQGDAIAQHIRMRLATWLGETPFDTKAGVPYLTIIFQPNTTLDAVQFILEQIVLGTPGVTGVNLTFTFDTPTRVLTVTGTAEGNNVSIDFSVTLTPPV